MKLPAFLRRLFPERNSLESNTDYSGLYQAGAVACYLLLVLPFCALLTLSYYPSTPIQLLLIAVYLAFGVAGYLLQMLGAHIFRLERKPQVFSYEDTTRRYRFSQAIVVHLGAVLAVLLMLRVSRTLRFHLGIWDDGYSLVPPMTALSAFVMTELGGYLWFFPYSTLISMRRIGTFGFPLLINSLCSFFYGQGSVFSFFNVAVLLLLFALFMLLLNQAFITRPYGGKIARGINDAAKGYSARIVGGAAALIVAASVVSMAFIITVVSIWYAIVKAITARWVAQTTYDERAVQEVLQQDLAGEALRLPRGQADYWVVVFVVLTVIAIVFLVILWTPTLRERVKELIAMLREFLAFLFLSPSQRRLLRQKTTREYLNFVDEVETTRAASQGSVLHADAFRTYAEFRRQLDVCSTMDEKIRFAYAVAAVQLRHQRCGVGKSDTPREIARKVKNHNLVEDIDRLTADFECLQYENGVLQHSGQVTLDRLCALIHAYI